MKGQDRAAFQYALGFPYRSTKFPETPQKGDARLKNEIGMNLGNKFALPLICPKEIADIATLVLLLEYACFCPESA